MKIEVRKPTEQEIQSTAAWPKWEKEPSEFTWDYNSQETCLILEGSATVTAGDGTEIANIQAGDYVIFPQGLSRKWKIKNKIVKKYYFG